MTASLDRLTELRRALPVTAAAAMFVVALLVPVWRIAFEAPQYPEGLLVELYAYPPPRRRLRRGAGAEPLRRVLLPGPGVRRSELRGPSGRDRRAGVDPRTRRVPRGGRRGRVRRARAHRPKAPSGAARPVGRGDGGVRGDVRDRAVPAVPGGSRARRERAGRRSAGSSPRRFWAATRSPTSAGGVVRSRRLPRGDRVSPPRRLACSRDSQVTVGEAPGRVRDRLSGGNEDGDGDGEPEQIGPAAEEIAEAQTAANPESVSTPDGPTSDDSGTDGSTQNGPKTGGKLMSRLPSIGGLGSARAVFVAAAVVLAVVLAGVVAATGAGVAGATRPAPETEANRSSSRRRTTRTDRRTRGPRRSCATGATTPTPIPRSTTTCPPRSTPRVRAIRSNSRASSSPRRRSSSTSRG